MWLVKPICRKTGADLCPKPDILPTRLNPTERNTAATSQLNRWNARLAALPTDPAEAALTMLRFDPDDLAEPSRMGSSLTP